MRLRFLMQQSKSRRQTTNHLNSYKLGVSLGRRLFCFIFVYSLAVTLPHATPAHRYANSSAPRSRTRTRLAPRTPSAPVLARAPAHSLANSLRPRPRTRTRPAQSLSRKLTIGLHRKCAIWAFTMPSIVLTIVNYNKIL